MSDRVLLDMTDGIAVITLNDPQKRNALSDEMVSALIAAVDTCEAHDDVGAVVLTGAGKGFCAGGDIKTMGPDADNRPHVTKRYIWNDIQAFPKRLATFEKPIIAAINGAATGAGMDYAMACDIRIAGESARFSESYARLGLLPGGGGAYFLPRLVGKARALELLWTADFVDAATALEIGLVNHVYPDAALLDEAKQFAARIAAQPPFSIRHIKRAVNQGMHTDLATALDLISSHIAIAKSGADHLEAVAALLEKREGQYLGY